MRSNPRARRAAAPAPAASQCGAALLMALIIVTVISTLAITMVWQQWRAVQVETAERSRQQSAWILTGALDWSRVILREDTLAARRNRDDKSDHLGEPWAVPLAEARLSTFLAADRDNTADAPDTFLSGAIVDAQSRYNLTNLIVAGDQAARQAEFRVLQRLCGHLNLSPAVAQAVLSGLQLARPVATSAPTGAASAAAASAGSADNAPLLPQTVAQFAWFGIDSQTLRKLEPYVVVLRDQDGNPVEAPVNANTASKEVLAAVLNVDLSLAERLVQSRQRKNFKNNQDVQDLLPPNHPIGKVATATSYFFVTGRLRLNNQVLEQRSLVQRNDLVVIPLTREWINSNDPG